MTAGTRARAVAVPAYFHPHREAGDWSRLVRGCGGAVRIVVVNPDTGVGAASDPAYRPACARLRHRGAVVAGYIDTAYTDRPVRDVLAEAAAYRANYALTAVFADQVTSGPLGFGYYRELADGLRAQGVDQILLNPGVQPSPAYLELADVVVTFEGSWAHYCDRTSRRRADRGRARTWHLVHSTPPAVQDRAVRTALARGATYVYATEHTLPNPWCGLPARWSGDDDQAGARSRTASGGRNACVSGPIASA